MIQTKQKSATRIAAIAAGGLFVLLLSTLFMLLFVLPEEDTATIPPHWVLPAGADAWDAGRAAYDVDDLERAVAYWKQVPRNHPQYSRSLRYIGWEVYADELGEPRKALGYVHRSVLEEPFKSNTWQDLGRTYAVLVGINSGSRRRAPLHASGTP